MDGVVAGLHAFQATLAVDVPLEHPGVGDDPLGLQPLGHRLQVVTLVHGERDLVASFARRIDLTHHPHPDRSARQHRGEQGDYQGKQHPPKPPAVPRQSLTVSLGQQLGVIPFVVDPARTTALNAVVAAIMVFVGGSIDQRVNLHDHRLQPHGGDHQASSAA